MSEQLALFAETAPVERVPEWYEAETLSYFSGVPDRSGIAAFTHIIRSAVDGERESREARQRRLGNAAAAVEWTTLKRGKVPEWEAATEALMLDGTPRTFNGIVLALTDGSMTADTAMDKDPDVALWRLVERGVLRWTERAPVFFLHERFIAPCSCAECAARAA